MNIQDIIKKQIDTHPVIVYMKGTPDFPQCGFSNQLVQILRQCGVPFESVDVLENAEIRQGIKDFSHWPTIPQLYIQGEFIGGADIVTELFNKGELQKKLAALRASSNSLA